MLISIIIPTHNRAGIVLRAVDSVLNQSYKNFELIVVDDGSTDNTEKFISGYTDPRLRYFQTPQKGVAHARNFGVAKSRGDWIFFLDSDDVWRKHKLSEQLRYHAQHPEYLISQTDDVWIRHSVRVNKMDKYKAFAGDIFAESLKLCFIFCSSVMMQKKLFEDLGGFDETFPTCEDYDLWLRLTAHHKVGLVAKPLVTKFGGHEDQLSMKFPMMDRYRFQALQKLLLENNLSESQRVLAEKELERKNAIIQRFKNK